MLAKKSIDISLFKSIAEKPDHVSKLTGLSVDDFNMLCDEFKTECENYSRGYTLLGSERKRASAKRKNAVLPLAEDKLLFILIYICNEPSQNEMASLYSMTQPQAFLWIRLLKSLLKKTLLRISENSDSKYSSFQLMLNDFLLFER